MRAHRPDVPLGAFERIPDFLPLGPDTDPLAVLTRVVLLGVDRDATASALAAQQSVRVANPKLAAEWDAWVGWCRRWQSDVEDRCNAKTHFFGPNDDASIESSEHEFVRAELTQWKLRWSQAGASGMGFPTVPPSLPERPPVLPPVVPPAGPTPPPKQPAQESEGDNTLAVLGLLGLAVVAFYVARGKR